MKKILLTLSAATLMFSAANADVIGIVDFDKIINNYDRVKTVTNEISDKYAEMQRYSLDKDREFKRLTTPLERKNFQEATMKELSRKEEAYLKLKEKKENEIDTEIKNTIKQVAIANKIDTVVEKSVTFFGGVDITDKVIKVLNSPSAK